MKFGDKKYAAAEDERAGKILASPDILEAHDWVKRYPKCLFSMHALDPNDPYGTPLAPVITRLSKAGVQRLVVHHYGRIFLGVVVVLPAAAKARKNIFAIDPELSQLLLQRAQKDFGQKYLYYSTQ